MNVFASFRVPIRYAGLRNQSTNLSKILLKFLSKIREYFFEMLASNSSI